MVTREGLQGSHVKWYITLNYQGPNHNTRSGISNCQAGKELDQLEQFLVLEKMSY